MAKMWPRLSKLFFVGVPVLLAANFFIENSQALSADAHASHDIASVPVLDYGVAPKIADAIVANPFLERPLAQSSSVGQWSSVEQWPLVAIHAAMLENGQIIMWDRENDGTTSMRLYNPATDTFTKIADPGGASVFCAGFVVLPDNRVVLNGGHMVTGDNYGLVSTNIYNPATGKWSKSGDMAEARWYPTTLTLGDGRLFTMGGSITPTANALIPEIYNTSSGTWSQIPTASMDVPLYPRIHLLPNGKVFFVNVNNAWSRTLDLTTGLWSVASGNAASRSFSSVQYLPGKIMISGKGQNTAVIDMNQAGKPNWRVTQPMAYSRYNHNLIMLPDGKVLAIGGSNDDSNTDSSAVRPAELWNPSTEQWTTLPSMATPRMYHSIAMLMQDGRVMVAGGGRSKTQTNYLNAEFYSPAYLFKGARPTISFASSEAPYGASMTVLTPDANSIQSVVLISNPSVTHAITFNQYYVPLTFTKGNGQLTVQIPTNKNIVPPGFYMLFLVNSNGVPSIAPIMKISADSHLENPPNSTPVPTTPPPPTLPPTTPPPTTPPPTTPPPTTPPPTTPPASGSQTVTLQVKTAGDDVNEVNGALESSTSTVWIGNGGAIGASYTGLRFTNIQIPPGATITSAHLEFDSAQTQWISLSLQMSAEAADNSAAFTSSSRPSQRPLTAIVTHTSDLNWTVNNWYSLNEMGNVIQQVIGRSGWHSGNSLSVILKGTATGLWSRKFARSFEAGAAFAVRLVITYST
ncbi:MAG: galactose oxidase-like domain-containing protein [Chloroflexota bacterium]